MPVQTRPDGTRFCKGYGREAHWEPNTEDNFAKTATYCRDCDKTYRADYRARKQAGSVPSRSASLETPRFDAAEDDGERVSDDDAARSHEYIPDPELVQLWNSVVSGAKEGGEPAATIIFLGPSGSGKTDGAAYLAAKAGLPFTKVDAASMTDPEAWFGTREVDVEDGASVTRYVPSDFVKAIQQQGVVFIDEFNRADDEHRNVWLPLTDGTGRVTNPLTGEIVHRHPHCFIVMAGNRGLQFTGTSAVDPAFMTRAYVVEFNYLAADDEERVVLEATGVDPATAKVFVRFANESRAKAMADPDFAPISTREVIAASRRVASGLSRDLAAKFTIINGASPEGGSASVRSELEKIWAGVRVTADEAPAQKRSGDQGWVCPIHGKYRVVPAGVSQRTGKPFNAFKACPERGCEHTEDRDAAKASQPAGAPSTCSSCGAVQPAGRQTICMACGAALQ